MTRTIPKVWGLVTGIVPDVGPQTDGLVEPTQGMLGRYSLDFRPALRTRHYEPFDEEGIPVRFWSAVAGYAIACFSGSETRVILSGNVASWAKPGTSCREPNHLPLEGWDGQAARRVQRSKSRHSKLDG